VQRIDLLENMPGIMSAFQYGTAKPLSPLAEEPVRGRSSPTLSPVYETDSTARVREERLLSLPHQPSCPGHSASHCKLRANRCGPFHYPSAPVSANSKAILTTAAKYIVSEARWITTTDVPEIFGKEHLLQG
jgi:hypothetical protein